MFFNIFAQKQKGIKFKNLPSICGWDVFTIMLKNAKFRMNVFIERVYKIDAVYSLPRRIERVGREMD